MKHATLQIRLFSLIAALLFCLPLLAACTGGDQNTDGTAETTTKQETGEQTTAETTAPEAEDSTEQTTEETTETVTEPPVTELKTSLSFTELGSDIELNKYFTSPYQCEASLAEDGTLKLSTIRTPGSIGASDPYVYVKLAQLIKALGYDAPDTREYPHIVLRVRSENRTGKVFSLFGYTSKSPSGAGVTGQLDAHVANSEEWQYIYFDLSSYKKDLITFRFDLTNSAMENGEALYISDITYYATAEEATALLSPDVYPIKEQTAENYTAKIMSFNVQTENGTQVRPDLRMDMLRDLIDEYMPDSIGMQEVTTKWRDMMDSYVFNQSYAGVGEPRSKGGEANPIYYRTDKFDLVDSGTFWLSDTPEVEGSALPGVNYPRICTWVHLRDKTTGLEYVHVNTHLDHNGNNDAKTGRSIRMQQFEVILRFVQRFGDIPMVLTGDLNQAAVNGDGEKYAVYKTMIGERAFKLADGTEAYSSFSNARYDASDNMPADTQASMTKYYEKNSDKYNPAKEPIDYLLYTPDSLTALSYKLRLYDRGGLYLSDHLPVICDIQFTPSEQTE